MRTRQKALYRCGKGPQNPQDFKKCDLHYIINLLRNIDLEMLPHLKIVPRFHKKAWDPIIFIN